MVSSLIICVLWVAIIGGVLGIDDYQLNLGDKQFSASFRFGHPLRQRRGVSLTARGALILRNLLDGTTPAYSKGRQYRNFHKDGDYVTALQDFFATHPWNVREVTNKRGETILRAFVGDRKLTLYQQSPATGGPMLDVTDLTGLKNEPAEKFVDRIIYRKPIKE